MSDNDYSKEAQILGAVKRVLTEVIKDTATQPGLKHPLSEPTINGLRDCLVLISNRERELAELTGQPMNMRPRYVDEPRAQGDVVIPLDTVLRNRKGPSDH